MPPWKDSEARCGHADELLELKQDEAAAAAGLSLATWNKIENGRPGTPFISTRRAIAKALGWTPDSIARVLRGEDPIVEAGHATAHSVDERLAGMTAEHRAAAKAAIEVLLDRIESSL
jgi:transcriptional regulator with XRE-family HTH domain